MHKLSFPADKMIMGFSKLISVVLSVFTNKTVIIATVSVILYLNFVTYVQHYHKKPPAVRKAVRKTIAMEKDGGQESAEGENGNSSEKDLSDASKQDDYS